MTNLKTLLVSIDLFTLQRTKHCLCITMVLRSHQFHLLDRGDLTPAFRVVRNKTVKSVSGEFILKYSFTKI